MQEIKDIYDVVERKVVVGAGATSPFWVTWLAEHREDIFSWLIPALTVVYIGVGILNRVHKWRHDWKVRLDDERAWKGSRRGSDDA